jgi:hypothetical protein
MRRKESHMIRRAFLGFALSLMVSGVASPVTTRAADPAVPGGSMQATTRGQNSPAGTTDEAVDLTGYWRFDPSRSDVPQRPAGDREGGGSRPDRGSWGGGGGGGGMGGHGRRGGMGGEGGGGMGGGGRGGMGGGGRGDHARGADSGSGAQSARPLRLPNLMHVTQATSLVSFEDSTGAVIREVTTVSAAADTYLHSPGAERVTGQWNGSQLVIQRPGWRGGTMTETLSLEDHGRSLVIRTAMKAEGDTPAREFKRVYRKEES